MIGRRPAWAAAVALAVAAGCPAWADRLHLSTGGTIDTAHWWIEGQTILYETGQGTIGIPRALVDRIESTPTAREEPDGSGEREALPSSIPDARPRTSIAARALDPIALLGRAQEAYAARDFELGASLFLDVIEKDERISAARVGYALCQMALGDDGSALPVIVEGLRLDPRHGELHEAQGELLYRDERVEEAVRSYRRAFEIAPSDRVREKILRAERELDAARDYDFALSSHFHMRYDGEVDVALAARVIEVLEARHAELTETYRHTPLQPIVVHLLPREAFRAVTQTPEWVGGVYDGKIRVPLGGLNRLGPAAERLLAHELTHAIVHSKSRGAAPRWLHEGLAQIAEGRTLSTAEARAVRGVLEQVPESRWAALPFRYDVALAVTETLIERQGLDALVDVLDHLAEGLDLDAALRRVYGDGHADIVRACGHALLEAQGSMTGTVALGRDPVRALAEVAIEEASGVLTRIRGKQRRLACIQDGALVHVASNAIEEQVDQYLVRAGLLTHPARAALLVEARSQACTVSALLAGRPGTDRAALERIVAERNRELFLSVLDGRDGEFRLERGTPNLVGEFIVPQACLPLLFLHAQRPTQPIDEVRVRIGPPNLRPVPAEHAESRLLGVELSPAARDVLALCDGTRGLTEIVARDPAVEDAALRIVFGLLLIGAIEPAGEPRTTTQGRVEAVTRDEVSARTGRAIGADHYTVLGLKPDSAQDEVRNAYYFLARRYHPDRFRSGDLQDLLADIERYFSQVTEAYNTLIDTERRRAYDEDAASRASGPQKDPQQDIQYLAKQNYVRGRQLAERRQYTEAVRSFENAILLDSSKAAYHLELGRVLALHPLRRGEAEVALDRAVEIDPSLVDGYLVLGELYQRTDRPEDAARMYREVLRWDPDHAEAASTLRELQRGRG